MKTFQILAPIFLLSFVPSAAFAVDGTITFNGQLVDSTCTPTVIGGSTPGAKGADATVTLPTLNVSALPAADTTGGLTKFGISLNGGAGTTNGCILGSDTSKTATPYFEPEAGKVNDAGRLKNTDEQTKKVVDIQLLTDQQRVINLSKDKADQESPTAKLDGNNYVYNYFARYYATDKTVAGKVTASVSYSIIYK
ncbi:fimbrial protein [Acinetobacter sp. MD2(2019)]|uniref:fimbrial protein n=1 Tax=Acinetobacter sp. MD2(2019) TaxID=2605273 RepID=UPI002D1E9D70|nr:fimbrial protein [Acinetobacter sp. MD2(2019)]MEB3754354.1 type 1 fimbrial protein [Acinetobacter sp. MD2(2019)]